eukprot:1161508-Pelagomonas_calceolata.AAC.1
MNAPILRISAAAAAAAAQVEYSAHKPKWHSQGLAKSHADSSRKSRLVHQPCYCLQPCPVNMLHAVALHHK